MDELNRMCNDWMFSSDEIFDEEVETSKNDGDADGSIKDEIEKLKDVMAKEGIEGVKQSLRANADKWMNVNLNIAVTGRSGAGKSAFINAIRDIEAQDEGGAKVGVVETTAELAPYKHPRNPNFIVWDMPGVGTPKFPKENYLERVKFDKYDFFMIVSKDRFTDEDLWLAKQTQERKKSFYFIRSNIDTDIHNDSRANRRGHSAEKVLSAVKRNCVENLLEAGVKSPLVFLVDSHDRQSYEFGKLEAQLLQDTDTIKMEAMALSLSALTKEVLKEKKRVLEDRIVNKALEVACTDDIIKQNAIFEEEISYYKDQFNLDDKTLQDNKAVLRLSEENLKKFQTVYQWLSSKAQTMLKIAKSKERKIGTLLSILRFFLGFDPLKSGDVMCLSHIALTENLDKMYIMALKVYGIDAQKGIVQSAVSSTSV